MAIKRVLRNTAPPKEPEPELEESWSDMAHRHVARYWYCLLCMFVDVVVVLEIYNRIDGFTGISFGDQWS